MQKTLNVLHLFKGICIMRKNLGRAVSVGLIASESGLSKSTVHRYLSLLIEADYIERVERGYYIPKDFYQWSIFDD